MKSKKITGLITVLSMVFMLIPNIAIAANSEYSCDFTVLVKDGQETEYGSSTDVIKIDDYTTAYLTYAGTYVAADGTVYPTGTAPKALTGSYIEFAAPEDGKVSYSGKDISYFIDGSYQSYGSEATVDIAAGQKLQIGYRKGTTYIKTLSFIPNEQAGGEPTKEPSGDQGEYVSPLTEWDFSVKPSTVGNNMPVIGGNAEWVNEEVKFPAEDTKTGTLTVDMSNPIKNNVTIEFDVIDHEKALGQQYFNFAINNSEETIVEFQVHPYDDSHDTVKGLMVCGSTIADYKEIRSAWGAVGSRHIKIDIDYNARKVTAQIGTKTYTGEIPEGTLCDVDKTEISSTRAKTAGGRYISVDNLKIEEFTSTEPTAPSAVAQGYEEETIAGFPCRVKRQADAPVVVYLAGEQRMGTDNISQLYDAKPLFDALDGKATLIAPQEQDIFTDITALVNEVNANVVIGQSQNAAAALSSGAGKIITIAGAGDAKPQGSVWAFAGYADDGINDIRNMVNGLQTGGVNTRYTEYPFAGHKINELAANENGIIDYILKDTSDSKTVDLAIFMGQSNMAGRGEYDEAIKCLPGHGFEYHPVTEPGVLTTISEPFGKYENNDAVNDNSGSGIDRRSGDMVSSFMESYYKASGTPIVGVQCSRGGTESKWWNSTERMTEAAARYNEAKAYLERCGYTIGKQFMVWCQGCSDADSNRNIDTYKSNTKAIFESMKTNTGLTDMFMIRIGHCKTSGAAAIDSVKDPRYKAINLAQKELADAEENITAVASLYTDEYSALMRDQYHYHQKAYNKVGTIAGNNTAYTLYQNGAWIDYPEPAEIVKPPLTVEGVFEVTSSEKSVDVSSLKNYGSNDYRIYKQDGSYETVSAVNGHVENTTGTEVIIVPEYKFEFTNQTNPTDEHIKGYVKVGDNSYTEEKGYGLLGAGSINENGCLCKDIPIRADLAKGFYDVEVYRRGGARADVYVNGIQIINNTTSSGSQNRPSGSALMSAPGISFADGSADFSIGNLSGNNERIASVKIVRVPEKYRKPVIWIAGDSESANYYPINGDGDDLQNNKIMMTGFGMQLDKVLSDKYSIADFGQPSATVKTWYEECFESVEYLMQKGDTLLIDFGINDSISSSNKITIDEMKSLMKEIADKARAKGAVPILISPVYNSKYQHRTYFTYDKSTDNNAMYAFAKENGIDCIDLNKWTQLYVDEAKTKTGDENWITHNYHVGDNLHLTQHSAVLASTFIAAAMSELGYETTDFAHTYKDISNIAEGNIRGTESGISRVYSVDSAKDFMGIKKAETPAPTSAPTQDPTASPVQTPSAAPIINPSIKYDDKTQKVSFEGIEAVEGILIKAVYDGDKMKSVSLKNVNIKDGAEVSLEEGMRLYLWNSLKEIKPLVDGYVYSAAAASPTPKATPNVTPQATPNVEPKVTPAVPTASPTPTEPAATPKIIYQENFESYNVGDKAGWTSPAGTMAIKSDSTNGIGKYQTIVSGKSGTCRSGYIELPNAVTKNFVFECDYKSTSNVNVSDIELVENKNSIYANHGVYSNANFAFTMARPLGSDLYVINNKSDDSGFRITSYADPVFTTGSISGNPWLHIKVVGDFDNQTVTVYVTSLDKKTEYYHGRVDMNTGRNTKINSWKCIHMLSPSTGCDTCIDNITVSEAQENDLTVKYHKVKLICKAYSMEQYVHDNESVVNIPDVSVYGSFFEGWRVANDATLYTSEQLSKLPITADCEITAVISSDYIENIADVQFKDFPAGGYLEMGSDENTFGANLISLSVTGEQGTSLVTNPDSRVNDYNVEWIFDGFRTLDGAPTGETGNKYCDSYAVLEKVDNTHDTAVAFKLKRTTANYYGRVTAKVTYNGKTLEVSKELVLLGDKSQNSNIILPLPGYTADFNKYENSMVGYTAQNDDIVMGGWGKSGSDSTYITLGSDLSGKYLSFTRAAVGNSSYVHQKIGNVNEETVFEQDVRFGMNGTIEYGEDVSKGTTTAFNSTAFRLDFTNSKFNFNGKEIGTGANNTWYHIIINAAPDSGICSASVYALKADGDYSKEMPLFSSENTAIDNSFSSGKYLRYTLRDKSAATSIDVNNVIVRKAEINENTFAVTAPQSVNIPESGMAEINISAEAYTNDGVKSIGKAQWKIDDEFAEGVIIKSSGNQSAVLEVSSSASSGDIPIRCTINGKSKIITIKLMGTKDNIAFINAPVGVQAGEAAAYEAVLRNGSGENIPGEITYELYDADNTKKISPTGISIDNGILTAAENAQAQIIGVRASCGDISRFVRVNIYNLKFAFGEASVKDGYTPINASTVYAENRGYGIEGAAAVNTGTMSGMTFKVKLEKGKVYTVKAKYKGKIVCENINSSLIGFERTKSALETDTFDTAVFGDGVMDITVASDSEISQLEITPVEKTAASKPDWWTIGDSTVQQNGSWGYTIASSETTDLSKYPELAKVVNGFHNSGKAGEQHKNFYSNGRMNNILTKMNPGDVVTISGMGTNDSSSTFEQFKEYDKAYMEAIIDMGGYVILGSYTPTGNYGASQGKVYDADTMTFKGMRTNDYDRAIRELYEESKDNPNVLGFLDIGRMADDKLTSDVQSVYNTSMAGGADEATARAAANARAEELMAWWKDYNHYYTDFSHYILPLITSEVANMVSLINQ